MNAVLKRTHIKQVCTLTDKHLDPYIFVDLLQLSIQKKSLTQGKLIQAHVYKRGFIWIKRILNTLINMYIKCESLEDARKVFDKMPERDVCSWTQIIAAYSRHGLLHGALALFQQMKLTNVQPNEYTYASILLTCASMESLEHGVDIHRRVIRHGCESDVVVGTSLVDMYAKCGRIDIARKVFDRMPLRDVVTWNAMMAGYWQNGMVDEALLLFDKMPERDAFSWTGMIAGFSQNGMVNRALKFFNQMPRRTVVSWNAMIAGLSQNEHGKEALKLFDQMLRARVTPDSTTFVSIVPTCAHLVALNQGMQIHEKVVSFGFQFDVQVANSLIDMYAKCGSIERASKLFEKMPLRTVVSWSAMIAGYAMHGCPHEALRFFEEMKFCGMKPDHITLVSVLSACSRAGLVEEGYRHFFSMSENYGIKPTMEHYRCMVDLLGRSGRLDETWDFVNKMPIKPDAVVWICLLGACRVHNNVELAEKVAEHSYELDSTNPAPYVLLSNIYAAAGRWSEFAKVRNMMKDTGIKKTPGCSWIEVNKEVHSFFVGDGYVM